MDFVLYEVRDRIATITLNRPEQRNAQSWALLDELDACWTKAAEDEDVRVIVLDANGPHFSAGHDMTPDPGRFDWYQFKTKGIERIYSVEAKRFFGYCRKWRDAPKPSIAAVQGACIAAGLMLCWPCDLIVAAENATFSDPVVRMGIGGVEYHGHTWEFGARKAKELLFTSGKINAEEAHRLGMVNRVVALDRLREETRTLAEEIAQQHPFALYQAKRAVNQTLDAMGQLAAMQACFDVHQLGHANALVVSGFPALAALGDMKRASKPDVA